MASRQRCRSHVTGYPGDLLHPGQGQRGEQLRGSGWPVAPVVCHRVDVPGGVRQGVRDDEPVVIQRAHGEQVLGTLPGGSGKVRTAQGRPGDGQRGGYSRGAVGIVRRPERRARHHGPVQAGLGLVGCV